METRNFLENLTWESKGESEENCCTCGAPRGVHMLRDPHDLTYSDQIPLRLWTVLNTSHPQGTPDGPFQLTTVLLSCFSSSHFVT